MTDPVVIEDATIRPHRVEWVGDTEYPCHVWYVPDQLQPNLYTVDEGEAMGLTPPQPAPPPTIDPLTTFDPNYDYPIGVVVSSKYGVLWVRLEGGWVDTHEPETRRLDQPLNLLPEVWGPYTVVHVPAATQPPSTADALHTLGLTDDEVKAAAMSAGLYGIGWINKVTFAAREAVQR